MSTRSTSFTKSAKFRANQSSRRQQRRLFLESLEDRRLLATLVSDKLDYGPGETAFLTASGYLVGETVRFQVLHNDGTPNTGSGHEPWDVTDGGAGDLDGLTNGNVKTTWYVDPDDSYRSSFEASALGLSSNLNATTTFTDEKVVDFRQAANDAGEPGGVGDIDWTSSILQQQNSIYFEGMSVMQRIYFTGFPDNGNDQIATLNFTLQFTKGGTHAYDWLTSWDQAISAAAAVGVPFVNIQVDPNQNTLHAGTENNLTLAEAADEAIGPPNTVDDDVIDLRSPGADGQVFYVDVAVPDDPFISKDGAIQPRIDAYESALGNRTIRIYASQAIDANPANTFLTLSHSVANGGDTGDSDVTYTLTIKFLGTAGEATKVMIEAAGHLAKTDGPDGWGAGLGSSQINGGPYHFTLGAADGTSIGNQDNQIKGADILLPAIKSGTKFNDLDADGVRDAGEPGLSGWEIRAYEDTDGDGVLSQTEFNAQPTPATMMTDASGNYSFSLDAGDYIVVEVLQAGWFQSFPGTDVVTATGTGLGEFGYAITLTSGETDSGNDFGNFQQATKSGQKFNDLDADGVKDALEPGLSGWVIRAYEDTNGDGVLSQTEFNAQPTPVSATTDASGNYSMLLDPGRYIVVEVLQAGWLQSFPGTDVVTATGTGLGEFGYAITLTAGQTDSGNDFGNFQNATKSGTKFNDLDGDGVRDSGEPGLAGWTINLVGTTGKGTPVNLSTVTDASGNYSFSVAPGTYTVSETQQGGWIQSFPDIPGDGDWDIVLTSGQVDTGNDFGNFQNATKSGTKFNDLDGDGVRDAGEPGLAGWTINLTGTAGSGAAVNLQAVTNASGNYSFTVAPGTYTVSEVQQAGWTQSFPDIPGDGDWDIVLTSGQVDTGNDFGNFQQATKSGTKFNDLDGDGIRDAGEPGLAGWTINLVGTDGQGNAVNLSTVTNASGNYSFTVNPGTYTVSEVQQAGWTQSFPDIPGDGDWDIVLTSGQVDTGNDFGNFQQATKSGTKFNDLDGDGVRDAGEPGLAGWTINLTGTTGSGAAVNLQAVTDASGNYSFTVNPGTYTVSEVQQAGWTQSFPDIPGDGDWDIVLTSGQVDTGNDFGNFQNATKSGTKFNDLDGDGVRDAGEPGLAGWTINLVGTTGLGTPVNTSTVTDASGNYSFSVAPGTYTVSETQQAGWIQSFPEIPGDGDWDVVLTSGQVDSGNDFGNFQNATKSGTKFNDLDGDGVRDAGEPGLAGWTINLTGTAGSGAAVNLQAVTNASGNYSFSVAPGTYTVSEVQQAGWIQSFPDIPGDGDWDIVLTSGQVDTGNDFGNFQNATKSGTKFNDLNGNGIRDAGEPGLVGWTINLTGTAGSGAAVNLQTVTNASGNYSFTVAPGTYTVSEVQQAGWTQSFPEIPGDGDWDIVLTSGQVDTGNDFGNFQQATKSGTKFHDLDADGVRDAGEPGLAGWTINLVGTDGQGNPVNLQAVTDASGNYSFTVNPGTYTVSEVQQAGWIQSFPDIPGDGDWDIVLTSGQVDTGNDFGNFQNATKSGTKFNDLNANGIREGGEPGLPGWTINLTGTSGLGLPVNLSTVTDASGNYSFSVAPGTYTVSEVQQIGWLQSFPDIPGDGDWDIVLTSGQVDTGNDFGNFQAAAKSGTKFNDLDGDGVRDAGEPGLAGWTINLVGTDGHGNPVNLSTVTDASGNYSFTVAPGTYTVSEVQQAGWIQSYPDIPGDGDWDIVLVSGQIDSGNDFGNFQQATKCGTKFNDLDGDGVRDAGEPGLAGWTINLVGTTGQGTPVNLSVVTDASGNYSFTVNPGVYTVSEVQQAGWTQSFPITGVWNIILTSGEIETGNDFGNFQQATKSGTKFNDLNGNGIRDAGEPGLAGWTINLVGTTGQGTPVNLSVVTDASGNYSFTVNPGVYTVSEVQQAGWIQSYPEIPGDGDWDIVLTSGQVDSGNDFGNFQQANKSGTKFHDLDGDGIRDAGEPGLPGWEIHLDGTDGLGNAVNLTAVTDASGNYSFTVNPGVYTVSEVQQVGWIQSYPEIPGDGDWDIVLTSGEIESGNDFGNFLPGIISWEKRTNVFPFPLQGGATFTITPNPLTGSGSLVVVDDGANDALPGLPGQIAVINVLPGTYVVAETAAPAGWNLDDDPTRNVTVTSGQVAVIGITGVDDPGNDDTSDFHNIQQGGVIVIGPDKSPTVPAPVRVIDRTTGNVLTTFLAYEANYVGGTRVATGDLTGDGIDEIITAPGRSRAPEIRVFTQQGVELVEYRTMAYAPTFKGGVHVAVGDVNGDGRNDIITSPSFGKAEIRVFFRNDFAALDPIPNVPNKKFNAFPATFIGGAFVRAADMGRLNGTFTNNLDGKAEIIVGSGPGIKAAVKVFVVNATAVAVRTINPFSTGSSIYKGGVNLDVANLNDDGAPGPAGNIPDLVIGTESGGNSRVETWVWNGSAQLVKTGSFMAFGDSPSKVAPVRVAAIDSDGNQVADQIGTVQGPNGTTGQVRIFDIISASPTLTVAQPPDVLAPFPGPYWIADINTAAPQQQSFAEGEADDVGELAVCPLPEHVGNLDLNGDGALNAGDAMVVINQLSTQSTGASAATANYDLNGDGQFSALDALYMINELNRAAAALKPALADSLSSRSEEEYTADVDSLFAAIGQTEQA